ncbi:L,D-transpeptidase family protein [Paracoccus laeviglucosivorans]|uniref:L,D-transpeptidase catalytic domain n=1 Tax=Paracoccus laeviglucosivorans TaxID=1197861 RepID=A0A521AUC5_9RHOB|nr:L,D-transpeptidase family protein [Paracoccus laeviglucosivorans]SMO38331.1 L,D-transpeptidase catalytic domain [Paracoccus laeviglucosivorans]
MKRLGGLFSVLALLFLTFGGWLMLTPGPVPLPGLQPPPVDDGYRPQAGPIALTTPIQRILIEKGARRMTVFQQTGPAKTFDIALGFSPSGDKSKQGDGRTPEGIFRIDRLNPQSRFHLSLGIDYPQRQHRDAARRGGYDPGGDIMIHGQPNQIPAGYRVKGDWTEGCIAVSDDEIEEIYALARVGTEVEIRP